MIETIKEYIDLFESSNEEEQRRIVIESVREDVLLEIIKKYPELIKWVIRNKQVPLNILHLLAQHPDGEIRFEVAMKRKLDKSLFELLSKDTNESVRIRIACNIKTPRYILEQLSTDEDPLVSIPARKRLSEGE